MLWSLRRTGYALTGGRVATPDEHAILWARTVELLAGYQRYADTAGREIPIVRPEPVAEVADA